jgi:serine/threonine protein kinase
MEHIPSVEDLASVLPQLTHADFIAAGGFKAVYRAVLGDQEEALKVIFLAADEEEEGSREQIIARVMRETEVLDLCQTPYLVKLGSMKPTALTIAGLDYLAYTEEFLAGQPLIDLIRQNSQPTLETVATLTQCVMKALNEIESVGHIHRDIKPHNVMATELIERPFVVLDLGIAFKMHGTELTPPGSGPPGTLLYMAPELFRPNYKDSLDIRSDVYSAGITVFEFAAGTHPLARRGEDVYTTLYRILRQTPPKLKTLRTDFPEWFCDMIDRCIKKTPALRFRNPQVFLNDLESNL